MNYAEAQGSAGRVELSGEDNIGISSSTEVSVDEYISRFDQPQSAHRNVNTQSDHHVITFPQVFKAEWMKGKRAAPRKIALLAPLPFFLIQGAAMMFYTQTGRGTTTSLWNAWFLFLMPLASVLIASTVANIDVKHQLRTILGNPAPPTHVWLAKNIYSLLLVLFGSILTLIIAALMQGGFSYRGTPLGDQAVAILIMTLADAWIVPVCIALTVRYNVMVGISVPLLGHLAIEIAMWSSSIWYLFLPSFGVASVSRLVGSTPDMVPVSERNPAGAFATGSHTAIGLAIAALCFMMLLVVLGKWFSKREAR